MTHQFSQKASDYAINNFISVIFHPQHQQLIFSAVQKFFGWGNTFPRMCLKLPLFRENTCDWKRKKATSMKFLWLPLFLFPTLNLPFQGKKDLV
jgi:hypothetical protein